MRGRSAGAGAIGKACLALLAALWPAGARAQGIWTLERPPGLEEEPWAINYAAGYAIAEGADAPSKEPSLLMQLAVEKKAWTFLWLGVEAGQQFGHRLAGRLAGRYPGDVDGDGQKDTLNVSSDVEEKVFHLTPYFRLGKVFAAPGGVQVKHTVSLGAGYYHRFWNQGTFSLKGTTSSGKTLKGFAVPYDAGATDHFGINFGTALDFYLWEGFALGAELRYHSLFDAGHNIGYIVPAFRLNFVF